MATLAVNVAFGGGLGFWFVAHTLCQYANSGALIALPVAALGSGIRFVLGFLFCTGMLALVTGVVLYEMFLRH